MKTLRLLVPSLAALLLVPATSFANDLYYDSGHDVFGNMGPNPTSWGSSENWDPNGAPISADSTTFSSIYFPTIPNVHLDGASYVADSLYLVFQPTQGQWRLGANGTGGTSMSATLSLTSGLISRSDTNDDQVLIIGATSGTGLLTGAVMTLLTSATGFTINQVDAQADLQIEAIMAGTDKTLTKNGSGLLTITRASTFTGTTLINPDFDGLNTLAAAVDGALGSTSNINVERGGNLLLSNSSAVNRIKNDAPIRLGGPVYTGIPTMPPAIRRSGGGNEGLGNTIGLGIFTLTELNAILDYGGDATGNGTLTFADFVPNENSTLLIRGYQGVFGTSAPGIDGTNDRFIFATDQTNNLLRFQFVHPNGMNGTFHAAQIPLASGFYEIVPVGTQVSTFQVSETGRSGNNFVLRFLAIPGQRYRVKASANLADGFPNTVATVPPSQDYVIREVTDADALSAAKRFYRVTEIGAGE
jgi:autotransporter-associated beta strand protein